MLYIAKYKQRNTEKDTQQHAHIQMQDRNSSPTQCANINVSVGDDSAYAHCNVQSK